MKNMTMSHLLRSQQAAEWMGISRSTLYEKVKSGELPGPSYRTANSVAWESSELDAAKEKMLQNGEEMSIKNQAQAIQNAVLRDLLRGQKMNHASIEHYKEQGMNVTMQHVIDSLRSDCFVIINHCKKENGYWYISPKNAEQYRLNPRAQRARKINIDKQRQIERRATTIRNLIDNNLEEIRPLLLPIVDKITPTHAN